jgi:hypothetical protein
MPNQTRVRRARRLPRALTAVAVAAGLLVAPAPAAGVGAPAHRPDLAFRGEQSLPPGGTFAGTTVGGLSSVTYDARRDVYYALSDDQAGARFYTLRLRVGDGTLDAGDVEIVAVTTLLGPDGQPFPAGSLDPEGLTLTRARTLVVTSEGFAQPGKEIDPFVREFSLSGAQLRKLELPGAFSPVVGSHGVRNNLGLESAAVTPNGRFLWTGAENALVQDGPAATLADGSPARLLRHDLRTGEVTRQYVYETEPVAEPPDPAGSFTVNGLVELLPLNNQFLLSMERSFSVGAGNRVQLYRVAVPGATDVDGLDDIGDARRLRPVDKDLLLDLETLGLTLDNLEGMTLGPRLPDGSRALVLVSDDNFSAGQVTQLLLFALTP